MSDDKEEPPFDNKEKRELREILAERDTRRRVRAWFFELISYIPLVGLAWFLVRGSVEEWLKGLQ